MLRSRFLFVLICGFCAVFLSWSCLIPSMAYFSDPLWEGCRLDERNTTGIRVIESQYMFQLS